MLPRSTKVAEDFVWGRERFLVEAHAGSLHHAPGIVRVYDFLEANGTAYMVMELIEARRWTSRLERAGRSTPAAIERCSVPLLDGLEQVHDRASCTATSSPPTSCSMPRRPTLIDFGASRAALAGRIAMTAIFTPGYAAAEQMTTAKQGPWTDIYGAVGHALSRITGQAPPNAIDRMLDDDPASHWRARPPGFSPGAARRHRCRAGHARRRPAAVDRRLAAAPGPNHAAALPAPAAAARAYRRPLSISVGIAAALLLVGGGYPAFEPGKSGKAVPVDLVAEVQLRREALAVAEQRARQREEEEAQVQRTAQQEVADRQRAEEEARRVAAARLERDRAEAEAARQKAEQEAVRLKAEAEARQRAESEAEARRTAEVGQAEKNCLEQETSARGRGGEGGDPAETR